MKIDILREHIKKILKEQTWESCSNILAISGFNSFADASNQCCGKCSTVIEGDQCYDFCQERCCEIEEPCVEADAPGAINGQCPPGFEFNQANCHCEPIGLEDDPCTIFNSMTDPGWKASICKACEAGIANDYQSNYCECCRIYCYGCQDGNPVGIIASALEGCPPLYTQNYELLIQNTNNCTSIRPGGIDNYYVGDKPKKIRTPKIPKRR